MTLRPSRQDINNIASCRRFSSSVTSVVLRHGIAACLAVVLIVGLMPQAEARRSLKKVHKTWELLLRNQLTQAYFCVGLVGDLYRGKIYSKAKARRYLKLLFSVLGREKLFLLKRKRGNRAQRAIFRHYLATTDMLLLSVRRLQLVLTGRSGATINQFFTYRNAAAKNINQMLQHPSINKSRYYRGGWRKGIAHLSHHLGPGLALGYLAIGLIADGYFQRVLSRSKVQGYLGPSVQLLQSSANALQQIGNMLNPSDHNYVIGIIRTLRRLQQQGASFGQFVVTRKRGFLARYNRSRRQSWSAIQSFAGP